MRLGATSLFALGLGACVPVAAPNPSLVSGGVANTPPPPTPASVTRANPGGDASDPEAAALERLATEKWSGRRDAHGELIVPLPDAPHWTRVRLWAEATHAAFRFGDDHFGILAVWYRPTTEDDSPDACLARFLAEQRPRAETVGGHVLAMHLEHPNQLARPGQAEKPMAVAVIDGRLDGIFSAKDYVGAIAASPSWPHTCLLHGFAVVATKHPELARAVRDRWVKEGAPRVMWHPRVTVAPAFEDK